MEKEGVWFNKTKAVVLSEFDVDPSRGLSKQEAAARLEKYGANELIKKKGKNILQLFIGQLRDGLIYVLLGAVIITLLLGQFTDSIIILIVITCNAVLGVVQEVKAGHAVDALHAMSLSKALVRRDGVVTKVDSGTLVPGDIVILDPGRLIAADIRLMESSHLQTEESTLTGESVPSRKDAQTVINEIKTPLGDLTNTVFMSTMVTSGRGTGVVVATGMNTEVGKIASLINTEEKSKTPLQIQLDKLGKKLGLLALIICTVIFIIALIQGRDLAEMFLTSVSLAVAVIPEGLAAIVAVVLSMGVTRMSKKNVIIKKMPSVETLGSVNIICSDKTGTLTQNKMTVTRYFNLEGDVEVRHTRENICTADVKLLAKAMILSSDATDEKGHKTGDPTEIALLLLGDDLGINRKEIIDHTKRVSEVPFDSDRKLMSTLVREHEALTVYTKGALVSILKVVTHVLDKGKAIPITEAHKEKYSQAAIQMSDKALRTLAVAYRNVDTVLEPSAMEKELILLGLVGMIDPPRTEVKDAIQMARDAGITSIMITGDHKNTAFAIAHELGIAERFDQAITGAAMNELSEAEFNKHVNNYRVYARVSPKDKVKIVHALKLQGNIVSMTGDGVNDAPSLNAADIGVAMGITGTDVAKQASDIILTDDNFATIVSAIEEGRTIYKNIRKAVVFLISCNLGEVFAMVVPLVIGWKIPLLATQLLWINLITDSLPAIALGMDPEDRGIMKEKPRLSTEGFFANGAGLHVMVGGLFIGAVTIAAFWLGYTQNGHKPFDDKASPFIVEYARTMAFLVLVFCQLFFSLASRNHAASIFKLGIFSNRFLIVAIVLGILLQVVLTIVPALQKAFHLQSLRFESWVTVVALALVPLILNEFFKIFIRANKERKIL
jgi:P-type Ca2+ transporter type 2C